MHGNITAPIVEAGLAAVGAIGRALPASASTAVAPRATERGAPTKSSSFFSHQR